MADNIIMTFVGESYAYEGFKFHFYGPRKDICPTSCRFYNTCMGNPKPDRIYEVVEVTEISHNCPYGYHEEPMRLVRVKEADLEIAIESKYIVPGALIRYNPPKCEKDCPYKIYCSEIPGIKPGDRIKILEVVKKLKAPACGRSLRLVRISRAE